MNFLDQITDTANQFANIYSGIKGTPKPAAPKPAAPKEDNSKMYLLIGGGALALILVLVFAFRK